MVGKQCDADGIYLPPGTPPPPPENVASDDWTPFHSRAEFETAEFLYTQNQMSAGQINRLLDLWASTLAKHNDRPPFADHRDLYTVIDSSPFGDVKWQCFMVAYDGERPENPKPWMDDKYDVWFRDPREVTRNMLANSAYANEFDYRPYREYSTENDQRQWKDFMSGDWADKIAKDPKTPGLMFVPIILGSDKTTVSVGTGNNEYYPLYASIRNICNNPTFRNFHRQLFHSSLLKILSSLKPGMTTPEVAHFGDGHYWRVVYGLGPYIADYEEQVLLTCIVRSRCPKCMAPCANLDQDSLCCCRDYVEALIEEGPLGNLWNEAGIVPELVVSITNDFPRADIYQMISPDILHQLIKGAFKDHLVEWVEKYLRHVHPKRRAEQILDDIDRRIAAGRGFKQWMGDDSKALMKVYLPAIEGHVPTDIVHAFCALLEFCYLVCRNIITEDVLVEIEDALSWFHHYREIFKTSGTIPTFLLPPVKEPWRRSSCFCALGQMLLINQRLDKISAARVEFTPAMNALGNIDGDLEIDDGPTVLQAFVQLAKTPWKKRAQTVPALAEELSIPRLPDLLVQFLFQQLHPDDHRDPCDVPLAECPRYLNKILVFNSASPCFYAPSDLSSSGGMRTEHICSSPSWRNEHSRYDCVFVARVRTFLSFKYRGNTYPCAVIHWFDKVGNTADEDTGMWIVSPAGGASKHAVIHIDAIYRAAHLIPVYGMEFLPQGFKCHDLYDTFRTYYVNKYADHHAFEIAF
ncbi:uncharacterized protein F5891DRAFT_1130500 [Suillus fuscotomentosus]|uniref:Uncharacterized protein n=1 Tax=Suillus fuscotomentosus TaxID=1912939 RepID=A0AAD4DYB1_9AGAM|nr:uncharacterized protein F5891DRAFT_1130500 [Suillus fuscotomentosus]KAG1895801.1 hypothetical protein F5891DRAFT_1130500 [Suillus fuscotomentosus]